MITLSDCEAFCDADPGWVRELAQRECLGLVQAYAQAHESMAAAPSARKPTSPTPAVEAGRSFPRAA